MKTLGFDGPLYILPFDHRGTFQEKLFGWPGPLTAEQTAQIAAAKQVIYDGFRTALRSILERSAGILVDEQFGSAILESARNRGYTTACPLKEAARTNSNLSMARISPNTSRQSSPLSAKSWSAITGRVMQPLMPGKPIA